MLLLINDQIKTAVTDQNHDGHELHGFCENNCRPFAVVVVVLPPEVA